MSITSWLCFDFPIGWNELGAIATSVAVVVALVANKKATKQLNAALKMQEQSKNVELLDKRISIIEEIQSDKEVSQISLQLLFNENIDKHYQDWRNHFKEMKCAEHDVELFVSEISTLPLDNDANRTVYDKICDFKYQLSMEDCQKEVYDEFVKFCDKHAIVEGQNENGELIALNYLEIDERLNEEVKREKEEKNLTIGLMKEFVSKSIQEIDIKQ